MVEKFFRYILHRKTFKINFKKYLKNYFLYNVI